MRGGCCFRANWSYINSRLALVVVVKIRSVLAVQLPAVWVGKGIARAIHSYDIPYTVIGVYH